MQLTRILGRIPPKVNGGFPAWLISYSWRSSTLRDKVILVLVHAVSKAHVAKMDKRSNKQKLKAFQNGENLEFEFSSYFQFKLGRARNETSWRCKKTRCTSNFNGNGLNRISYFQMKKAKALQYSLILLSAKKSTLYLILNAFIECKKNIFFIF